MYFPLGENIATVTRLAAAFNALHDKDPLLPIAEPRDAGPEMKAELRRVGSLEDELAMTQSVLVFRFRNPDQAAKSIARLRHAVSTLREGVDLAP